MLRAVVLLLILAPLAWWLDREQRAGRFQRVDELFLDFLVANSRDKLTTPDASAKKDEVLLVRFDPADRAEYAGWPPQPIDWQMVLKGLREADNAVIVIPEPLHWGNPPPEFLPALAGSFVPLSSVVLGVEAQPVKELTGSAFTGGLENVIPRFHKVHGELGGVPAFSALIAAPEEKVRRHGELGLVTASSLPYVMRDEASYMPGVIAQVLARHTQTPYATHRLLLGPGAGAYLSHGLFVPLSVTGDVIVDPKTPVATINALDFLAGGLADALGDENKARIKSARVIVIGTDDASAPGLARQHAQALAGILALPRLQVLDAFEQWIVRVVVALIGMAMVIFTPRQKCPTRGFLCIFGVIVVVFLGFQSTLLWFPPTIPVALLSASAIVGSLIGRRA